MLMAVWGCGEGDPSGDPGASPATDSPAADSPAAGWFTVSLPLTFHRGETPVQVGRTVEVPMDEGPPSRETLVGLAVEALLAGPTAEEAREGITSFFSDDTRQMLRGVQVEGDTAVVDLTGLDERIPNASSSAGSAILLTELNSAAFSAPGIAAVRYQWDGSCERFWEFLQRGCRLEVR